MKKIFAFNLISLFYVILFVAAAVGTFMSVETNFEQNFECTKLPATDDDLQIWLDGQPAFYDCEIVRKDSRVTVRGKMEVGTHSNIPLTDFGYTVDSASALYTTFPRFGPLLISMGLAIAIMIAQFWWSSEPGSESLMDPLAENSTNDSIVETKT